MLRGLIEKGLRETWRIGVLISFALSFVMALFVQILPEFQEGLNDIILQVPFIRALISGMMGMDVSEGIGPQLLLVVVWSHPIVLSIVWGFVVVLSTRVPAGEIEKGTIDVLLGLPVSRSAVYISETLVWLAWGVCLFACAFLAFQLSALTLPANVRIDAAKTLLTVTNFFAVYIAVGCTVQCISVMCDRRGKALGIALAFLLASFLLQFLSTLWEPAKQVVALSFAHYYQPAQIMMSGKAPWLDIVVLVAGGAAMWTIGLVLWRRRSVLTT